MNIAVIAWGSLFWDKRELRTTGEWLYDGPRLPLEFSKLARDGRLTLVIKPGFDEVQTLYIVSAFPSLTSARQNLKERENADSLNSIGYVNFLDGTSYSRDSNAFAIEIIKQWNKSKGFDAVIWTDFAPNFSNTTGRTFTVDNVISYLQNLGKESLEEAKKYILNTHGQIQTRFRSSIEKSLGDPNANK